MSNINLPETAESPHLDILPMGRVDTMAVSVIAANVQAMLGLNVLVQDIHPEPEYAFLARRGQFEAGKILRRILSAPARGMFKLGVVNVDIFTPILTFVYGESQLGGSSALISTFRIQSPDLQQAYDRAAKIGVHEVAHLLGLVHCRAPDCLMAFSNSSAKLDGLPLRFCRACEYETRRRLRHLFGSAHP